MAVIVKYIVVRNGEEKMTFATKKEADAYDKMLDIADNLFDFLGSSDINLDENQQEKISLLIAEQREEIMPILRGISPKKKPAPSKAAPPKSISKPPAQKASPAKSPAKKSANKPAVPKAAAPKKTT